MSISKQYVPPIVVVVMVTVGQVVVSTGLGMKSASDVISSALQSSSLTRNHRIDKQIGRAYDLL